MKNQTKNKSKISITTLGCKVNQVESEAISAELQKHGYQNAVSGEKSNLCIINTCTVTQKAAMQSRQAIRRAIRENPEAIILATGCYAQSEPLELKKIKGLQYIIGNANKQDISQIISSSDQSVMSQPVITHQDIGKEQYLKKMSAPAIGNRTRPFVKIQDGCDNFCTYCVVPYTRGPSRSLPPDDVMDEISLISRHKSKEIVLTGIHLGRYGVDLHPPTSLLHLLSRICDSNMIHRIRLSSIEPNELTDDLLNYIAASKHVCHHFHIPLQSGDKTILKKMNRPYDPELFKKLVGHIHRILPDAAIGVDVMIGFPGETDDAFNNTYELIKSLPISYLHVFPFSPRPGTPAEKYKNQIDHHTIKIRRNKMMQLGHDKKTVFYNKMIEKTIEVLLEDKRDTATGYLTGVSSNYVRVLIDADNNLKNKLIICRIKNIISPNSVLGEPVS